MKMNLKNFGVLFLLMGCIGITVEIFFTAITDLFISNDRNFSLKGYSYIWMFPIYGFTAIAFPIVKKHFLHLKWYVRGLFFGCAILIFEYICGALLRFFTGTCPWEYTQGIHIHGLIRLDYYPFWVLFSLAAEQVIIWLHPRLTIKSLT